MNIATDIREKDWFSVLEAELSERSRLVDLLDDAVRRQSTLIEEEDADGLVALLDERQGVVDRIERGAERLVLLLERFQAEAAQFEASRVGAVRELIGRIGSRLDRVLDADARALAAVEGIMNGIRTRLQEARVSSRAKTAYTASTPAGPRFSDRKA